MNLTGTQTIDTKRLILRRFTLEDAEDMYNNWALIVLQPAMTAIIQSPEE